MKRKDGDAAVDGAIGIERTAMGKIPAAAEKKEKLYAVELPLMMTDYCQENVET